MTDKPDRVIDAEWEPVDDSEDQDDTKPTLEALAPPVGPRCPHCGNNFPAAILAMHSAACKPVQRDIQREEEEELGAHYDRFTSIARQSLEDRAKRGPAKNRMHRLEQDAGGVFKLFGRLLTKPPDKP